MEATLDAALDEIAIPDHKGMTIPEANSDGYFLLIGHLARQHNRSKVKEVANPYPVNTREWVLFNLGWDK